MFIDLFFTFKFKTTKMKLKIDYEIVKELTSYGILFFLVNE